MQFGVHMGNDFVILQNSELPEKSLVNVDGQEIMPLTLIRLAMQLLHMALFPYG